MKSEFFLELSRLLDKFSVNLVSEPGFGEFEDSSVTAVFEDESIPLGNWVDVKNLKEIFKDLENNCKL